MKPYILLVGGTRGMCVYVCVSMSMCVCVPTRSTLKIEWSTLKIKEHLENRSKKVTALRGTAVRPMNWPLSCNFGNAENLGTL